MLTASMPTWDATTRVPSITQARSFPSRISWSAAANIVSAAFASNLMMPRLSPLAEAGGTSFPISTTRPSLTAIFVCSRPLEEVES